jgi:signal transduction histidine kinase
MQAIARLRESVNGSAPAEHADAGAARERAIDWFWTLASFGLGVGLLAAGGLGPESADQRELDLLGVLLVAGMSFPLLARRRFPVPVFLAVMASLVVVGLLRYPPDVPLGAGVALFTLAREAGRQVQPRLAIGLALGSFVALAGSLAVAYGELFAPEIGFEALIWLAIWFAGRGSRLKHEHIASLEERAERAEREAEKERMLAAAEERTRIARDLHDSAGHAINVILVEAGAARLLRERDPERAEQALETIEEVAREQIGEIDRLVHALRAEDEPDQALADCETPGDAPKGPAAGDALFERMRASGLDLEVEWEGERRVLGPRVGRASYRILQEALTNALRHGTGSATVVVRNLDSAVEFTVENPTANGASGPERFGLTGMRERVGLLGGDLDIESDDGLFRVRALLPYDRTFDPRAHFDALADYLQSAHANAKR